MSIDPKRKGFTSTTPPASLTKLLLRSLSRLKSRTPSNTIPVSSFSLKSEQDYIARQRLSKDIMPPFLRQEMASLLQLVDS
ncbi:unnamed protein product [Dovyalis caffra]|uniref:Uncharacterized protein n=1 Tax=Dovyalis caffra TaxID=77055 RepID=A0AAV1QQX5_9ROSI|nr:unnamed protein product [Dovyalis caffra]